MWKKWRIVVAMWILALILVTYHGGRMAYMLLYFTLAVPLASLMYVLLVTFRFKFYQKVENGTIIKGEPVEYEFSVRNEDKFFYPEIAVEFRKDYSKVTGMETAPVFALSAGEGREITTKLCCNYRGEYEVGIYRFFLSDYLQLFTIPYRVAEPLKVTVLPRITNWKYEKEVFEEPLGRVRGNTGNGDLDVQVRNYRSGDELRQIHWKAYAKSGKLYVREREVALRQGMLVYLDLRQRESLKAGQSPNGEAAIIYEDELMEQAVAVVYTCLKRRIPVTLVCDWNGQKMYRIYHESQWEEFYKACGKMCFTARCALHELEMDKRMLKDLQYAVFLTQEADGRLFDWIRQNFSEVKCCVSTAVGDVMDNEREVFESAGIRFFVTQVHTRE